MFNFQLGYGLFAEVMILKGEKKQGNKAAQGHIGEYFPLEIGSYGHVRGGGSTVGKKCFFIIMQPGAREKWSSTSRTKNKKQGKKA
jgi:hypothetical protein